MRLRYLLAVGIGLAIGAVVGPQIGIHIAYAQDPQVTPDPAKTPGDVASTDFNDVCSHDGGTYSQRHRLSQTPEVKRQVLANYGVAWADRGKYEDDHDVPLCLGGSDSPHNRWAQPRFGTWDSAKKDKLEAYACREVCGGHVPLATAQAWFTAPTDWRLSYCAAFPSDPDCPPK